MSGFRKPSLMAWLLLFAGLALFVSAGRWQYGKAQAKRAQEMAWVETSRGSERASLSEALLKPVSGFDRVRAAGAFLPAIYLLDNQVRDARAGVEVFVPLRTDDGALTLVTLGWLPYTGEQRRPPDLPPLPAGDVALTGLLAPPPAHGIRMGRGWAEQSGYPKLMPYFALDEIEIDLGRGKLAPRILRIDAEAGSPYRRDWQPTTGMPPTRHQAYALQWWSLAAAAVIVFLVVHRKRHTSS